MEKLCGWTGKVLRIDLTTGEKKFLPTQDLAEKFIGGISPLWAKIPLLSRSLFLGTMFFV